MLDWEAALPEEDLEISDAQSKMADLRYRYISAIILIRDYTVRGQSNVWLLPKY